MRLIDLEAIRPNIRHEIEALDEVKDEVLEEADPEKRRALIHKYAGRWRAVREAFEAASDRKCWYAECRSEGADNDIDHYRPKGRVAEEESHPGYYWLAFEWTNLRLSCQRANRPRRNPECGETGGKGDHFPLVYPDHRAFGPSDDLSREVPSIVDPTNPVDVAMLTFGRSGELELVPERRGEPVAEAKLEASRRHLHLDWPGFREERLELYNQIELRVRHGEALAPQEYSGAHPPEAAFLDICRYLVKRTRPDQEYSKAARAYLEMFRDLWWIREIVLNVA